MTGWLAPRRRTATWSERASTSAVFLSLGICTGAWAASLPILKHGLALSDREISVALLAFACGSILSTIATGLAAPWLGTGRGTLLGALAMPAALALPPLAGSLGALAGATLVAGLAMGLVDVSMNGHASAVEERWGSPVMSSFHGAFSLGGLGGAALGGMLAAAGFGAAGQLWIAATLAGLINLAAIPALGEGAPASGKTDGPIFAKPSGVLVGLGIVAASCFVVEGAMGDWTAIYLDGALHSGLALASAGYAAFSIAMAATRFAGDRAVARVGARSVVVGGGLLAGAGLIVAVLVPMPLVAACGFALVGLGLGNVAPVAFGAAARAGTTPAAGVAPVAMVGYAGFLLGPPIIGLVSSVSSLRVALAALILAVAMVSGVGAQVAERRRRT